MKITASELKQGVEVDLPVEWQYRPARQCTIKYNKDIDRFVMADIKTKEVHFMGRNLKEVVDYTNRLYNLNDVVEEE